MLDDERDSTYLPYDDPPEYTLRQNELVIKDDRGSSSRDRAPHRGGRQLTRGEHESIPHSDGETSNTSVQFSSPNALEPDSLDFNVLSIGSSHQKTAYGASSYSPEPRLVAGSEHYSMNDAIPAHWNADQTQQSNWHTINHPRTAVHPSESMISSSAANSLYETAENEAGTGADQHYTSGAQGHPYMNPRYSPYIPPPQPVAYDPLFVAASSVLGGPPTDATQATWHSSHYSTEAASVYSNLGPSHNSFPAGQSVDTLLSESSRPTMRRDETFSPMPSTRKSKAIDVNHPPYTRKYVDEYRVRIKGDPDPEAHFRYAKYLIDAAKKIGADAADQKSVRKYRDGLIAESLKVVRRLATQGETYPEAQFFLANCHGTGMLGLQIDHERAYHLYLQAAKQNHASAAYRVAVCNEIGAGTRRDTSRAFAFYRKAASLGDTPAMYKLGMILLSGTLNQAKNPREAIGWLKRAAEQADEENPHALHELGLLHEVPNSNIVVHDDAYAKELFIRAANLGYTQSQFKLGQCYEFGSPACPIDPKKSIAWYTKAAEKGDPEAELALSGWYLTGSEGVLKQSDSEAYLWARRAANKGLSKAEYAVGYYAEVGIGVKQDLELAKRWYMRAAAQGNKRAMARLTEIKRDGNKKRSAARPTRQQANKEECIVS